MNQQKDVEPETHVQKNNSDHSESSSSDSDEEQKDWIEGNRQQKDRVLPSLGDELNHAKCIKDLSFYKLNWENIDLEHFHRPEIGMKQWT